MKVYLINLDRRPDRLAEMTERLNALGLEFERISAVDAKTAKFLWHVSWWKAVIYNLMHLPAPGAIACYYSHRAVWADMLAKNIPQALILEDDAEPIDWDGSIASINLADFQLDMLRLEGIEPISWVDYGLDGQNKIMFGRAAVNEMSYGTAAYLITNEGAKKCNGFGKFWFNVDHFDMWVRVVGLKTAVLRPTMFRQSMSVSDIDGVDAFETGSSSTEQNGIRIVDRVQQFLLRGIVRASVKHLRRVFIASQVIVNRQR